MAHLYLVTPQPKPPLSLLAHDFQPMLAAFNQLTRDLRDAGANIRSLNFLDKRIVISGDDLDIISRRFGHEIRSQSSKTSGLHTLHSVRIRDVNVSWFSRVKEQDK
ncbi:hypothetical protein OH710_06675 [Pseudomonas capsici]|uniref:hypothetical protein n=1 Tax=Pseudomonas capsici TaxID=2810614 RepID=UPI0021F1347B|nr:hypothetical protein [Pseudomonas capsici]MCV4272323.1 hypothetical protein [Pseudomonas capsici]